MNKQDELLDLVDNNDQVIGKVWRSKTQNLTRGYLRASELLIINEEGKLWIPRRQMHKRIEPGGLDFSAAGHVESGDTYMATMLREAKEELNLILNKSKLVLLNKFTPKPHLPPYFRTVYLYTSNEVPKYNTDDFSEFFWFSPKKLVAKLKSGEPAKKSLLETVEFLINNNKNIN